MIKTQNITKEDLDLLYTNSNDSGIVVAQKLGITYKSFVKILKKYNIPVKGRRSSVPQLRDKEWLKKQYYDEQKSCGDIAKEIGATKGNVYSALLHLGIKFREANEALRTKYPQGRFGDKASNWRGGIKYTGENQMYKAIYMPQHPHATQTGYVMEHRLVMEEYLGRYLTPKEVVHHKNGDKKDNRIENLELVESLGKHTREHYHRSHITEITELENARLRKILDEHNISY